MSTFFPSSPTTSGATTFAPTAGDFILNAFDRIGVRPTAIEQTQMQRAIMELNLALVRMDTMPGQNQWSIQQGSVSLTQGTATYNLPASTRMIFSCFIRYSTSPTLDRYMFPISRDEYAAISTKTTQGFPSQYFLDRQSTPTVTFYLVPDGAATYTFYYYAANQIQDAAVANGQNLQLPYRMLDAITADLAHRLARIYRPELEDRRKMDRDEAWSIAATEDTEWVPMAITPALGGYYRR